MTSRGRFPLLVTAVTLIAVALTLLLPYHEGAEYCGSVLRPALTEDSGPCISNSGPHLLLVYVLLLGIPFVAAVGRLLVQLICSHR